MKPVVYFIPFADADNAEKTHRELGAKHNLILSKFAKVFELSGFLKNLKYGRKVAIKVHFGEEGNNNYLKPYYVREVVKTLAKAGVQPFMVETSTLYRGKRNKRTEHIELAQRHGFTILETMAPIEILDGKAGEGYYEVPVSSKFTKLALLGHKLRRFLYIVNLAHFKGHFATGFGGVLKNLGMGLAAKGGKLDMHSESKPYVNEKNCIGCAACVEYCPQEAISLYRYQARIGPLCTGCCGCFSVCDHNAIEFKWDQSPVVLLQKIVEYAKASLLNRYSIHFNFLVNITPNCDCYPQTEEPIMSDIGILASLDPLACEQAAYDFTKEKIKQLYLHINPELALDYAEELGIGKREYELCEI